MSAVPSYDAAQLGELLGILPGVDAVELKLTVPDVEQRQLVRRLEIDSLDAVIRQVAFLDTDDLRLSAAGVVVRARRTQRKPGDLTVKVRPMLPVDVSDALRGLVGFKIEVDASPAGYTCSCSLSAEVADRKVKALLAGDRDLSSVLDDAQRELLLDRLPEDVGLDDLRVLGPVHLLKCKFAPHGFARHMVGELWFLPDGGRLLELSTKCAPSEAFQVAAEVKVLLARHGADLGAPQEMKTRTALAALAADAAQHTDEE